MVCSCAMPSNCLAANNILLKHKGNHAFLLLGIALVWKWQIASFPKDIHYRKQTHDLYRDLSLSHRSIIFLSLRLWQIVDLLATDKSRYFAQPRPVIVNYFLVYTKTEDRVFCSLIGYSLGISSAINPKRSQTHVSYKQNGFLVGCRNKQWNLS